MNLRASTPAASRRRDLVLVGVLLLLSLGAAVAATATYGQFGRLANELNAAVVRHLDIISRLEFETQESRRRLLYALTTNDTETQLAAIEDARVSDRSVRRALDEALRELTAGAQPAAAALSSWSRYALERDEVVSLILEGRHREAVERDTTHAEEAFRAVRADLDALRAWLAADAKASVSSLQEGSRVSLYALLAVVTLSQFLAAFGYRQLQKNAVVDQLRAAAKAAEEATQAKSAFLASMSHELRTPLNAIIGYGEMLKEDVDAAGPSQMGSDLQSILSAAKHLLSLINAVLDFSKIEAGRMDLDEIEYDLTTLVQEVATTGHPLATARSNTLSLDVAADLGRGCLDVTKLRQVLLNLVANACKFTEHGRVCLRAVRTVGPAGAGVQFEVSDTGIGMSPEQLANLYQEFVQGDSSTARKYGGTGLGLALSKRLVELMGGTIGAASVLGRGSTFTVTVPLSRRSARSSPPLASVSGAAQPVSVYPPNSAA